MRHEPPSGETPRDDELLFNDGSPEVQRLYVWVLEDKDGIASVLTAPTNLGLTPLVFTDQQRAAKLRGRALIAARGRRKPARLLRFDLGGEIMRVDP